MEHFRSDPAVDSVGCRIFRATAYSRHEKAASGPTLVQAAPQTRRRGAKGILAWLGTSFAWFGRPHYRASALAALALCFGIVSSIDPGFGPTYTKAMGALRGASSVVDMYGASGHPFANEIPDELNA
jgi:hypothetical protein